MDLWLPIKQSSWYFEEDIHSIPQKSFTIYDAYYCSVQTGTIKPGMHWTGSVDKGKHNGPVTHNMIHDGLEE